MRIIPKPVCASRSATAQTLAQLITVRAQHLHNDRQKSDDRVKVSRYSNGHKYPKQKQRMPNLTSFAQISLAIMFTTNSCIKHRILHVLRDSDVISHVKTGEINADVLIADVIRKCNF